MTDKTYKMKNIIEMTDLSLMAEMGKYIKHHRLRQNMTQGELASHSGVKRSTLSGMENGGAFNVITLIKLLRSLDLLTDVMRVFDVPDIISPSMYIKMQKNSRKRARHPMSTNMNTMVSENKNNTLTKNTI